MISTILGSTTVRVGSRPCGMTSPVIFGIQGVRLGSFGLAKEILRNDFEDEI